MDNLIFRHIKLRELKKIYFEHMTFDFPPSELPPYKQMRKSIKKNNLKFLILTDGKDMLGYVSHTVYSSFGYTLINHLAIDKNHRNKGMGKILLERIHSHVDSKASIIEVEDPKFAKNDDDKKIVTRRIDFYERDGYELIDGNYELFKVPMRLMLKNLTDECCKNHFTENKKKVMKELLIQLYSRYDMNKNIVIERKYI